MYKATQEIGGYKKGDIVPDEQAKAWLIAYDDKPVEEVADVKPSVQKKEDAEQMSEDYLDRPMTVVVSNIKKDKLSDKTLKGLLDMEKSGKRRKSVIEAINTELI